MLKFKVTGQRLMRTDGSKVVGDSRNYLKAKFDFSEDWDDYTPRIASFWRDNLIIEPMQAVLDSSGTCVVPWEMLQREGVMRVSVCAGDLVTANEVCVMIDKAGKIGVLESTDPSPGVYANIYNRLTSLEELVKTFGNASLDIVDELPDVEDAEENVLYLVKNSETGYYDVYVLIDKELVLIDDRDIDLSDYYTKEETDKALTDYYTKEETDETLTDYYTKEETDEALTDYYTKEETDSALGSYLPLSGGTMSGSIDMGGSSISNAKNVTADKVITPKVTAEEGTNVVITNTFETSTYDSVVDTVKLNSSGFDISGVSTKEDGTVYTNQIKTSNSKMTVNANDLAVNSSTNINIAASNNIKVDAYEALSLNSNDTTSLKGDQVDIEAQDLNVNISSGGSINANAAEEINLTAEKTAALEGAKVEINSNSEDIDLNSSSNVDISASGSIKLSTGEGVNISADGDVNVTGADINIETENVSGGDIKIISPYKGEATGAGNYGTIRAALTNMDTEDLEEYRSSKVYIGKDNVVLGILKGRDMDEEGAYPTVTEDITTGIKARKTEEGFYTQVVGKLKAEGVEADSLLVNEGITGDLTGNAETASALETARTIQTDLASTAAAGFDGSADVTPGVTGVLPLANGGTGAGSAADARTNLELDSNYRRYKYACVERTAAAGADNWFKFAEISVNTANTDQRISFKVSTGVAVEPNKYSGILTAHVRTGPETALRPYQSGLWWEYAGSEINPEDFVFAYSDSAPVAVELWVNISAQYNAWHFDVIAEGTRGTNTNFTNWTLYQTTEYSGEITEGYTQIVSTLSTLQNNTTGAAATLSETLSIEKGGTGGSSAEEARVNLGLGASAETDYDTEVTADSENLVTSGAVYEAIENVAGLEKSLETYFLMQKTGKVYQTKVYKYSYNTDSAGEKLLANEGLVFEPSTDTEEGTDDYESIPLFQWMHCNYIRDDNGDPYITAIKGDGNYAEEGLVDVGAFGMTFYYNVDESNEEYDLWTISDSPNETYGLKPWAESVRADGSIAPYWCHSAFFSTTDTEDGLPRSLPGKKIETFVSYSSIITSYAKKGAGYKGAGACRQLFGQIFSVIMTGSKNSQSSMYGVNSWNFQYTAAEESEEENTYFPVTAEQAANLEVGLCVSVGYMSSAGSIDRGGANMYAYGCGVKITSIEQQDDDLYYVYLDVDTPFSTAQVEVAEGVTSQVYMSSWHCYAGMTDNVIGKHNGSPVSNTDRRHPFRIQGTEYACGAYFAASDTVLYNNEDYSKTVYAAPKGVSRSSTQSVIESTYTNVGTIPAKADGTGDAYYIGDVSVDEELGVSYPSGEGGSNSTGYADQLYSNTSVGLKRCLLGGNLNSGSGGGLFYVSASYALSGAHWHCAACD